MIGQVACEGVTGYRGIDRGSGSACVAFDELALAMVDVPSAQPLG